LKSFIRGGFCEGPGTERPKLDASKATLAQKKDELAQFLLKAKLKEGRTKSGRTRRANRSE